MAKTRDQKADPEKLSPREERFCNYLMDPRMSQARAYIKAFGPMKLSTAAAAASRLLATKVNVARRLQQLREEINKEVVVNAAQIKRELQYIAHGSLKEIFDKQGNMLPPKDWPDHVARAIQSVEVIREPDGTHEDGSIKYIEKIKVRLWPKTQALQLLGQTEKMFTEVHEFKDDVGDRLEKAKRNAAAAKAAKKGSSE